VHAGPLEELRAGSGRIASDRAPFGRVGERSSRIVERATIPKAKEGKKSLTQDQVEPEGLMLSELAGHDRDESDKTSPGASCSTALEPQNPQEVRRPHARRTQRLETTLPMILVMLGPRTAARGSEESEAGDRKE
jgi:hypothetical protein